MAVVGVGVAPVGVGFGDATPSKERDSDMPSGGSGGTPGDRHWSGMQAGCPGIPRRPGSVARADGIRFGRKGTAEPSGRGASGRRRFCRRSSSPRRGRSRFQGRRASVSASKIRPGPGSAVEADVRTRIPSAPAPLRHRSPQPSLSRPCIPRCGSPYPTRFRQPASEVYAPRRGVPLRIHRPGKPPTFHPASESPSAHPY